MEDQFKKIFSYYGKHIHTEGNIRKPVLIVFSAIPGSGKSELSKLLERNYGFLRITNKDIRTAIEAASLDETVSPIAYTSWLLDTLINRRTYGIVFDRNIDQVFEPIQQWCVRNDYKLITVRIDVDRHLLHERLMKREGDSEADAFKVLDFYASQHAGIKKTIYPSVTLENDYNLIDAANQIAHLAID